MAGFVALTDRLVFPTLLICLFFLPYKTVNSLGEIGLVLTTLAVGLNLLAARRRLRAALRSVRLGRLGLAIGLWALVFCLAVPPLRSRSFP